MPSSPSSPSPAFASPSRPRVVVIGAGILGITLARELARRGAQVTVVEREAPAAGATSVSFAWLTNQTCFRNGQSLSDGSSRHYFGLHRLALAAWRRLHHDLGDALPVRWNGAVQLEPGHGEEHDLLLDDLRQRLSWGSPSHRIGAEEARNLLPGAAIPDGTVGFFTPDEGSVDPNAAVSTLVRSATELGVEFRHGTEALSVEGADGRATAVVTSAGRMACDHVAVLCGADSPSFLEPLGITVPLADSHGSIVHLKPLPPFLDRVLLSSQVHAIQRRDGRVVIAKHYSGTPVSDPDGLDGEQLLAQAADLLPALREAEIEKITVGRRVVPADGLPVVGRSPVYGNLHSVTTNAGITLGPVLAQLMTTEILDGTRVDVLDPYRSTRFETATPGGH
ncbi:MULTISPECIES: FAD-binding oxidoreductase [unclassified Streptomyces]|uniref:NAD(P)/FAD-dependent oxidoreductase n=1 Tax=unclassified Streptomyces TaxID=2593676 RepID=UPI002DDA1E5A|nr:MULTISPECIES: FAD-binding oxidoreductase [unclassified Streptomyces]WSA92755.1 FAD-binding oxidoreductase [Streptomyces sp. NBC_01795]WSS14609.1 FAD-binding oxidoreductase [Streptomyces sp. NBC_01186]WSS43423.1 FAD-binding oxidoreductase [Streptomyces sp. NBC_01187]